MNLSNLELTGLGFIFIINVILFIRLKVIKDWLKTDNDALRQNLSDSRLALHNERKIWKDKTDNLIESVHEWKQKAQGITPLNIPEPILTARPCETFVVETPYFDKNIPGEYIPNIEEAKKLMINQIWHCAQTTREREPYSSKRFKYSFKIMVADINDGRLWR